MIVDSDPRGIGHCQLVARATARISADRKQSSAHLYLPPLDESSSSELREEHSEVVIVHVEQGEPHAFAGNLIRQLSTGHTETFYPEPPCAKSRAPGIFP